MNKENRYQEALAEFLYLGEEIFTSGESDGQQGIENAGANVESDWGPIHRA